MTIAESRTAAGDRTFQCLLGFSTRCDAVINQQYPALTAFQCLLGFSTRCDNGHSLSAAAFESSFQCLLGFSTRCDRQLSTARNCKSDCFNAFSAFRPAVTTRIEGEERPQRSFNAFSAFRPAVTVPVPLQEAALVLFQCLLGFSTRCDLALNCPVHRSSGKFQCLLGFSTRCDVRCNHRVVKRRRIVSMPSRLFDPL